MKLPSHKILKKIVCEREINLTKIIPLLPKRFGDYRDFYPLAILCSAEYIKSEWSSNGEPITDEKLLSSIFYSKSTGSKSVNSYNNPNGSASTDNIMFYATAKADLYFTETRSKRNDRLFSILVGIVIGVGSAMLTLFIKSNLWDG